MDVAFIFNKDGSLTQLRAIIHFTAEKVLANVVRLKFEYFAGWNYFKSCNDMLLIGESKERSNKSNKVSHH